MEDNIERLKNLDNEKLISVVKNYRHYGYSENMRTAAISLLIERGITEEELKLTGNLKNTTLDYAKDLYESFSRNSRIAFMLYTIVLAIKLLTLAFYGNIGAFEIALLIIYSGSIILYLIFLIKSFLNQNDFYKVIGKSYGADGVTLYVLLGAPFYFFMYFYFRQQMKEKMQELW